MNSEADLPRSLAPDELVVPVFDGDGCNLGHLEACLVEAQLVDLVNIKYHLNLLTPFLI